MTYRHGIGLFTLLLCFLLLSPATLAAELLRGGFYEAEPRNTFLGPLLHLHSQDMLDTASPGRILKGLRGKFGGRGEIATVFDKAGKPYFYWSDPASGRSDWLTFTRQQDGTILLRTRNGKTRLRLRFAGIRAPGEEAAGIRTRYLVHRGFSYFPPYNAQGIYPANTLPALSAALEEGYGGFELDVRVTRDGKFVVSHDENVGVATSCSGDVHEKTLGELRSCYVNGSTLIPEVAALRTPTITKMVSLGQVLARFALDPRFEHMVIDVKPDTDSALLAAFREAIEPFLGRPEYLKKLLVIVHSDSAIRQMREINPWSRYFLEGDIGTEPLERGADFLPEAYGLPRAGHDSISLNVGLGMYLPPLFGIHRVAEAVRFAQGYGYPVMGWTVSTGFELSATRALVPELEFLLTDAPMSLVGALELGTFFSLTPSTARTAGPGSQAEPALSPAQEAMVSAAIQHPIKVKSGD